jgi:hypothetical protein
MESSTSSLAPISSSYTSKCNETMRRAFFLINQWIREKAFLLTVAYSVTVETFVQLSVFVHR